MSSNFQWYTEEDGADWEQIDTQRPETPPEKPRRWLFPVISVLLVGLVAMVVLRQMNQRLAETTKRVTEDVLAVDELVRTAAADRDGELLVTLLSGLDPQWTDTQSKLLEVGWLFEQAGTPFGLQGIPNAVSDVEVELSSDFNEAVVSGQQPFTVQLGEQLTETVVLEQAAVYREGRRNWLLAPPSDEFWGDWATTAGERVTVVYRQRDEEFAIRLGVDLERTLLEMCELLGDEDCQVSAYVRLDPDPESLLVLNDPLEALISGQRLNLPTPTLIGTPVDEAGYQALYRGYAALVVQAVMTEYLAWECCTKIVFYRPLVDKALEALDLRVYPLRPADFSTVLNVIMTRPTPPDSDGLQDLWSLSDPEDISEVIQTLGYAFVQYLLEEEEGDIRLALRSLVETGAAQGTGGIAHWIRTVTDELYEPETWSGYVAQQVREYQAAMESPRPLPEQDLLLYCLDVTEQDLELALQSPAALYHYNPSNGQFAEVLTLSAGFGLVTALPRYEGVIITSLDFTTEMIVTQLLRPGREPVLVEDEEQAIAWIAYGFPADPQQEQLMIFGFSMEEGEEYYGLVDVTECTGPAPCQPVLLPGQVTWSPDGSRLLTATPERNILMSDRDELSWTAVADGTNPFWLDNETYGYVDWSSRGGTIRIVLAGREDEATTLLSGEVLASIVPDSQQRFDLIHAILPHPTRPERLFILAGDRFGGGPYSLLQVSRPAEQDWAESLDSDTIEVTYIDNQFLAPFEFYNPFSPDGRWLMQATPWREGRAPELLLLNLDSGEAVPVGGINDGMGLASLGVWSADSSWLFLGGLPYGRLVAPADDGTVFSQYIFLEDDDLYCFSGVWINR